MRKILRIKQSFHIPYDMNLLNKTFQFNYESLFVDKNCKIQPLRLSRDLILQGPKVLAATPVVMGTKGLVPAKLWKPLACLSNIFTRLIVSGIVIYIQFSIWFFSGCSIRVQSLWRERRANNFSPLWCSIF